MISFTLSYIILNQWKQNRKYSYEKLRNLHIFLNWLKLYLNYYSSLKNKINLFIKNLHISSFIYLALSTALLLPLSILCCDSWEISFSSINSAGANSRYFFIQYFSDSQSSRPAIANGIKIHSRNTLNEGKIFEDSVIVTAALAICVV